MAIRDCAARLQEVGLEQFVHETEPDGAMRNAEFPTMPHRKGDFLVIML